MQRWNEAGVLDDRRVQMMRDLTEHDAKVAQFFTQRCDAVPLAILIERVLARPVVQLVLKEGYALQGVVMHLARDPCALVFLSGEQALGVFSVKGNDTALIENEGGTQGEQDDA